MKTVLFFLSAFSTAAFGVKGFSCASLLHEGSSFPIHQVFRSVKILKNSDGFPAIPYGSRAFVLWRQKTPPWIPDIQFALQYLEKEESEKLARTMILNEASETPLDSRVRGRVANEKQIVLPSSLEIGTKLREFSNESDEPKFIHVRWVEVEIEDKIVFVYWHAPFLHSNVSRAIAKLNPVAQVVGGGIMEVALFKEKPPEIDDIRLIAVLDDLEITNRASLLPDRRIRILRRLLEDGFPPDLRFQNTRGNRLAFPGIGAGVTRLDELLEWTESLRG